MRMQGLGRQLYVDLVRKRSRVRVVAPETRVTTEPPIFILGVYRSGTTLLRYVLDSHPHIACPPESNFLHRLGATLDDREAMSGLESMGFDRGHVLGQIRSVADYFFGNYAASRQKPRWADKTPLYIDHLALLHEIFPTAQYVVIHRNPLDQIHSHTKNGTFVHAPLRAMQPRYGDIRTTAAHYWVDQTQKILAFAKKCPPAITVTYEELCTDPRWTITGILRALGEPWAECVLDFQSHPHDQGREAASIQRSAGFALQTGGYRQWQPAALRACTAVVSDTATALGYELGA